MERDALSRVHVMHVLFSLCTGGLEKQVVNVINRTDRERFRHSVCCLDSVGPLAEMLETPRPTVHLLARKPGLSPSVTFRLARMFAREKVGVVHARGLGTYMYSALAAKMSRAALVYGEHGDLPMIREKRRRRAAMRALAWLTDGLYAVSEAGRMGLADLTHRAPERVDVIPNGVETDLFRPGDAAAARGRIGIGPGGFVIGFVGRVAPVKNLGALFAALPEVSEAVGDVGVVIAGDGPDMENVRRMAAASRHPERVLLLGERRDVADLLPAMSVLVLPSFSEGHSNVLLEAMAAGCPVVASDVGGNPEIVRDGETGFLFAPARPGELAERLVRLARSPDLRRRLGENARNIALAEFSMDVMIGRYEALYSRFARR